MKSAIDQLASQLANVSAADWAQLAAQERLFVLGAAWDELSERLAPREPAQDLAIDQASDDASRVTRHRAA